MEHALQSPCVRIVLLHNPTAGSGVHSFSDLTDEMGLAGHEVVAHAKTSKELKAVADSCDLVIAAGGDGTVGKAAEALAGTSTPLAIIPLGTANNIAHSLGVSGSPREIVQSLDRCAIHSVDSATALLDNRQHFFLEAFGYGAFPRVMGQTEGDEDDLGCRLTRDRALLRERILASPVRNYQILADGQNLSGSYFLVEVLNVPWIGPRVRLTSEGDPRDGKLDLVLAGEADRSRLIRSLQQTPIEACADGPLRRIPAERIEIRGAMRRHHVDGHLHDHPSTHAQVEVCPGNVRILAPARGND